jgi:hypothetical protein
MLSENYRLTIELANDLLGRERRRRVLPDVERVVLDSGE